MMIPTQLDRLADTMAAKTNLKCFVHTGSSIEWKGMAESNRESWDCVRKMCCDTFLSLVDEEIGGSTLMWEEHEFFSAGQDGSS